MITDDEVERAYSACFHGPAGQIVLADLVPFCRGIETCVVPGDVYQTFVLEGRREVLLRILNRANLAHEELQQLRFGRIKPKAGG